MIAIYVLIIAIAMPSYDGGLSITHVPFATKAACEAAAREWDKGVVYGFSNNRGRGYVRASCHATGAI